MPHSVFGAFFVWCSERWSLSLTGCKLLKTQYTQDFSTSFPRCLEVQDCTESQENRYITSLFGLVETGSTFFTEVCHSPLVAIFLCRGSKPRGTRGVWKDHFGTQKLLLQKDSFFFQGTGSFQFTMPTPLAEVSMASEVGLVEKKQWNGLGVKKCKKNGEWFVVKKSFGHFTRNGHP